MNHKHVTLATYLLTIGLLWITGCDTPNKLKTDYVDYDKYYAEANNKQLLLNLARLSNFEPINFIQLGSFSSQHQVMFGVGFNPNYTVNSPSFFTSGTTSTSGSTPPTGSSTLTSGISEFFKHTLTLGGSANASTSDTPIFQFLPVTGTNLVDAVMNPVSDKVYYTFYDQGYPADWVTRIMVQTIEYDETTNNPKPYSVTNLVKHATTNIDLNGITNVQISMEPSEITTYMTNVPVTTHKYYNNNPNDRHYPEFLEFCSKLYKAQALGLVVVSTNSGEGTTVFAGTSAPLKDIVSAVQSNLSVKWEDPTDSHASSHVTVKQPHKSYTFVATEGKPATNSAKLEQVLLGALNVPPGFAAVTNIATNLVTDFLGVLRTNISTNITYHLTNDFSRYFVYDTKLPEEDVQEAKFLAEEVKQNKYTLKMRTVETAMFSVAAEERLFRGWSPTTKSNSPDTIPVRPPRYDSILYGDDQFGPYGIVVPSAPKFSARDVTPLLRFATDICTNTDPVFDFLRQQVPDTNDFNQFVANPPDYYAFYENMSDDDINYLRGYSDLGPVPASEQLNNGLRLKQLLAVALNALIINGPALDTHSAFTNYLSRPEIRDLTQTGSDGGALRQQLLNAVLLTEAYPPLPFPSFFKVRPLMKLTRRGDEIPPTHELAEVDYDDQPPGRKYHTPPQTYFVGDPENVDQNRVVFTILSYLFAQSAISTQNLPVQQLIQVP